MTSYASLLSLGHILDQLLQHPSRQMAVLDKVQIDSLLENITFMQNFLEDFSLIRGDEIQAFEEKIARSAYAAEDIIEKRVADQILQNSEAERRMRRSWIFSKCKLFLEKMSLPDVLRSSSLFSQDLQTVIEEIGSMKKDVMKIMEQPRKSATAGSFVRGTSDSKNTMVGFDEDLIQIMEKLTGHQSNLRIISIVGMGGIGKTTLATNVYHHPCIVHHFHIHAWATISQQYSVQEILLTLLKDIRVLTEYGKEEVGEEIAQPTDDDLGERLYRSLSGRKYLIVLDDLWSIDCWNDIKRFIPDNNNGSRVMITTRLKNVADDICSSTPHQLRFLNDDQSWALFCNKVFGKESCPPELEDNKVFGKESCPPELEEVGKTIVRNCGALPLAIVAISGLLAKSGRALEFWEYVANDTNAALNMGGDELCFEILSLSYKYLPVHLKPCFLYMAIFPEDHKIKISRLVKLWVAEGIVKPIRSRSLEEIAEDNLKDLVDRNLIVIQEYGSRNNIKTCTIHDLVRDLCLREAQKEKFLCVTNNRSKIIDSKPKRSSDKEKLKSTAAKMHKLLLLLNKDFMQSYEEIVRVVNSRFIDFEARWSRNRFESLECLSLLWNLQTVTIRGASRLRPINLPAELWEMPQLRHLKGEFYLPDPPCTNNSKNGGQYIFVLRNLQTLCRIRNFRCTNEVALRIPNLKKLGINYCEFPSGFGWNYYEAYNLSHLRNLESLFLECVDVVALPVNICFPSCLKKLTLSNCGLCWDNLTVVSSLPHLEVLNLMFGAVKGRKWNPVEGEFCQLKSLRISYTDVEEWIADSSHFPRLEKLQLEGLRDLKEIPYGIGEIQTLRSISLLFCSDSANSSAETIQEEQQNLGNYDLKVCVDDFKSFDKYFRSPSDEDL